jgi:cytochrome P450
MSFGDGPHRCLGAAVALHEGAIFLDHLFRVPGIRLAQMPTITSNPLVEVTNFGVLSSNAPSALH